MVMKRILLASLAAVAFFTSTQAQDIGGSYKVQGTNFNGSP
jgi:hypothetical protein